MFFAVIYSSALLLFTS